MDLTTARLLAPRFARLPRTDDRRVVVVVGAASCPNVEAAARSAAASGGGMVVAVVGGPTAIQRRIVDEALDAAVALRVPCECRLFPADALLVAPRSEAVRV